MITLTFKKTGKEIKNAIVSKLSAIQQRLQKRNTELDELLAHPQKIRSYILRSAAINYVHGGSAGKLYGKEHISSEEVEEINQMCKRIMQLENEATELKVVDIHLNDNEVFEIGFAELLHYGFTLEN